MALVTQTQGFWGAHAPDIADGSLFGAPLLPNDAARPEGGLITGWTILPGDTFQLDAIGLNVDAASLQLIPPGCAGQAATLDVTVTTAHAAPYADGANGLRVAVGVSDGAGNWLAPPAPFSPTVAPTVITLPLTSGQAAAGLWVSVLVSADLSGNPAVLDFTTGDAAGITVTAQADLTFDDAACNPAAGCVGEASHLDDCGVTQWAELLQQTVDALRPQVRWSCICDDDAPGVTAWQQWSSPDNGLTWTLLGTFTEKYGTTPYVPVGVLVDCDAIGVVPTGTRARRAVLTAGSTTAAPYGQVAPPLPGLPSVGSLVESLSWSSRNATGTITDAAGTVSTFIAGEGDTWSLEWTDTIEIAVTTGEVVVTWSEVY